MNTHKLVEFFLDRFPEVTRQDWLTNRYSGIGGSEIGTILGINKWQTPYELYQQKKGLITVETNTAMRRGKYLEPLVAELYQEKTGNKVYDIGNRLFIHPEYKYIRGTPDRLIVTPDGRLGILEIKTASGYGANSWIDGIPEANRLQAEYYTGITKDVFKSLFGSDIEIFTHIAWLINDDFDYAEIPYNEIRIKAMYEAATSFWNNLENNIEPDAKTYSDIKAIWKEVTSGKRREGDETILELLNDRAYYKEHIKFNEEKMEHFKERNKKNVEKIEEIDMKIRDYIQDAEELVVDGKTVVTCSKNKPSYKFDEVAARERYPNLIAKFMVEKEGSRVLRYKDKVINELLDGDK